MVALWAGAATVSCKPGVTSGTAYEAPLIQFPAPVEPMRSIPLAAHPLVGLIWSDPLQRTPDVVMPARWIDATSDDDGAYQDLTIRVYRPPPPEALVEIASASNGRAQLALGSLVLIDDGDGDGAFHVSGSRAEIAAPDSYLAGSAQMLVYMARPFEPPVSGFPLTPSMTVGYQLVDFECAGRISNGSVVTDHTFFESQAGRILPELRSCMRSHSP